MASAGGWILLMFWQEISHIQQPIPLEEDTLEFHFLELITSENAKALIIINVNNNYLGSNSVLAWKANVTGKSIIEALNMEIQTQSANLLGEYTQENSIDIFSILNMTSIQL